MAFNVMTGAALPCGKCEPFTFPFSSFPGDVPMPGTLCPAAAVANLAS